MQIRWHREEKEVNTNRQYLERRKQYKITIHQALLDNRRNSKNVWETVRNARRKKRKQPEIDIERWRNHLGNILCLEGDVDLHRAQARIQSGDTERLIPELDNPITEQEVHQAVRNLKSGKAAGFHNICGKVFKHAESAVVHFSQNFSAKFMIIVTSLWTCVKQ